MTTAGEAAALFGADDSAADPFALDALGAEREQAVGQDPFAGQELHSATDLFGSAAADDGAFSTQVEPQAEPSYDYTNGNGSWNVHDSQYTPNYSTSTLYNTNHSDSYSQHNASQT